MSWVADCGTEEHEGHVAMLDPKGRSADATNSLGLLLRRRDRSRVEDAHRRDETPSTDDMYESVPWSEVSGWRVQCECGWRGTAWGRGEAVPKDPSKADVDPDVMLLTDGRTVEDAGYEEWNRHVEPTLRTRAVSEAAKAAREAQAALDAAVAAARASDPPATWEQIGRAVDITRQSAHDRWANR